MPRSQEQRDMENRLRNVPGEFGGNRDAEQCCSVPGNPSEEGAFSPSASSAGPRGHEQGLTMAANRGRAG
jgi:hypothetical protein